MENKRIDITHDLEQYFVEEILPKLPADQREAVLNNPEIIVDCAVEAYKQVCKERGIDYTTTAMYQEELKYRQQKGK